MNQLFTVGQETGMNINWIWMAFDPGDNYNWSVTKTNLHWETERALHATLPHTYSIILYYVEAGFTLLHFNPSVTSSVSAIHAPCTCRCKKMIGSKQNLNEPNKKPWECHQALGENRPQFEWNVQGWCCYCEGFKQERISTELINWSQGPGEISS